MSIIDTRTLRSGHQIESDVCIIGSGAAGLAVARSFLGRTRRVSLLESGGMTLDPAIQSLYRGRVLGQSHAPLDACRLRYFGGTTNHWTAHVRQLEATDFEAKPWVPHSGWPFGREELAPYYERARKLLRLPENSFDLAAWQANGRRPLQFDRNRVKTRVRQIIPESRRQLGPIFRDEIEQSRNVDAYLFANVLRIDLEESRERVRELTIGTLAGVRLKARARHYVLAAGGIEIPRILLLSSIGSMNDQDKQLVGGFYANHPPAWGGYLQPSDPRFDLSFHRPFPHPDGTVMATLILSEEVQRQFQLLNCSLEIFPNSGPKRLKELIRVESTLPGETSEEEKTAPRRKDIAHLARDMDWLGTDRARGRKPDAPTARPVGLRLIAEPSPNPTSRVRLDDPLDAFGQRRAALDWRLDARDSESARETLRVLSREVGASGMGRLRILFPEQGFESIRTVGAHHHMGTTRMHPDSSRGVVDSDCRVHGISNLFIAGSSVFPTYGAANPTYTILAPAFRLADHLREELGR